VCCSSLIVAMGLGRAAIFTGMAHKEYNHKSDSDSDSNSKLVQLVLQWPVFGYFHQLPLVFFKLPVQNQRIKI
jgi:hypothetical protein